MSEKFDGLTSPQILSTRDVRQSTHPHRLGVHQVGANTEIAIASAHASGVQLCLLFPVDEGSATGWVEERITLKGPWHGVWHAELDALTPGTRYGFRVRGPWDPEAGLLHNPAKFLFDPYARAVVDDFTLCPAVYGHAVNSNLTPVDGPRVPNLDDSAPFVPHAVVVDDAFDGVRNGRPRIRWEDTVIYEAHVRGLTKKLPGVPKELRGTYAGVAHPATIEHLRSLGITTLELLPIHALISETHLLQRDLTNYWGYNTLGFFAPNPDYASADARNSGPMAVLAEVKGMVALLHDAGIEVLLDVVYNHTCEAGSDGPTLAWRGLDNTGYYAHDGGYPAHLADVTGCGNTLDFRRARVIQMTLDSLRYWADYVGIDGYRFDLAVTLGRGRSGFDPDHPFLIALRSDPVLSGLKLIAEPWDLGPSGWQTGQFPAPMAEWNDRFRDAVRTFWLRDVAEASHGRSGVGVRELATRLSGSADLFSGGDPLGSRGPLASVNFVTAHDGFTLADLTIYDHKHNEANGEDNRDGTNNSLSWNHGVEGVVPDEVSADPITMLRRRSIRNLMASLILGAGVPMITAGDEIGRTQDGNNNAYCQDTELSWIDWNLLPWQEDLLATARHLLALRRQHPALRPTGFYSGKPLPGQNRDDLSWFKADGAKMAPDSWHDSTLRTVQMVRAAPEPGSADILIVLHGGLDPVEVQLAGATDEHWELQWDSDWDSPDERDRLACNSVVSIPGAGTALLEPLTIRVYAAWLS